MSTDLQFLQINHKHIASTKQFQKVRTPMDRKSIGGVEVASLQWSQNLLSAFQR